MKKYAFMIFVVVLAAVMFAAAYFIEDDKETVVYAPRTDLTKPAPTVSEEPEGPIVIKRTQLVYFYDDSTVFHIEPYCSGMGEINGRPCGQALDMGIVPCGRCMKDYMIK